jgi:small-conductance mechanosensitive channel
MKKLLPPVFIIALFVFADFPAVVVAQDQPKAAVEQVDAEANDGDESSLEAPAKVDVSPVARDSEIAQRLSDILKATKWFEGPVVEVDEGVVFLNGEAKKDEYKTWAGDLAGNTQDVAAVVNRMKVTEKSIWDFSEAFAELRSFQANTVQAIPLILFGIAILFVTWVLAKLASSVANRVFTKRIPNSLLRWVATRAVTLPILILGCYLVLRVAGLTQLALTVLGGTGLIGLVIGIAFQDIAENFLASILISIQKPFRIGDLIRVDNHEGIVQRVTTRGTALLTANGNHVQIPNSKIYKNTIENFTANPRRRVSFDLGIGYDDSASDAQLIMLEKIKAHSATLNDPAPKVLIESLGSSTVNLTALFWIDGTKNDFRSVRSSVMRISKQALLEDGISMPDEAREVIFPNGVPVLMNESESTTDSKSGDRAATTERFGIEDLVSSTPAVPKKRQAKEQANTEAEGNMASETDDLKKQAEQSWLPGEGEEILVGEE